MQSSDFNLDDVNDAIAGTEFHGSVRFFPAVSSTMDLAAEAGHSGVRQGVWIADEQTAGRGRGSHAWHSAPGEGLYMTALTSPPIPMLSALRLTFRVAIAVQSAIAATAGFRVRDEIDIRWPNDLILKGRKCGGILIDTATRAGGTSAAKAAPREEARYGTAEAVPLSNANAAKAVPLTDASAAGREGSKSAVPMLRYALIGIGINVNHLAFPPELEAIATSLRRELPDRPVLRREPLVAAILRELDQEVGGLLSNPEPRTSDLDRYSSWLTGKRVRVEPRDGDANAGSYTGTTAGLDSQGFLRVLADDGELRRVLTGGLREL